MAGDQYLNLETSVFSWKTGVQAFTGSSDAGKLIALNSSGYLDPAMIGPGNIGGLTFGLGPGAVATNTVLGVSALAANTTGARQVAIGYQSLVLNQTGNDNVALGYFALKNLTGSQGTAVGASAGQNVTTGTANTFLGYASGPVVSSGSSNTILGAAAGAILQSGSNNIYIGQAAAASSSSVANEIVIGQGVSGGGTNTARLGNSAMTEVMLYAPVIRLGSIVAVAALPAAAISSNCRATVNNATQTLTAGIGAVVAGGGANIVPVFCDGTNWRIG